MSDATAPVRPDVTRRLGVVWTGGLAASAAFLSLLAILERVGLPASLIPPLIFGPMLVAFAAMGVAMRTMLFVEFDAAGRSVPLQANTVTIATIAIGLAVAGDNQLAIGGGAAVGLFASGLFVAPAMRATGAATIAELLGRRHGRIARLAAAVVTLLCCLPAVVALINIVSLDLARALGVSPAAALRASVATLLCASVFGGMRGLTAANLAAGAAIVIAVGVAIILLVWGSPGGSTPRAAATGSDNALLLAVTVALGTVALPPLCQRFASAVSTQEARRAVRWAALLVAFVAFIIPAVSFDRASLTGGAAVGASLMAAAAIGAMLAAAVAFAFATANTLSNDIHRAFLAPRAAASRQLILARMMVVAIVLGASRLATETGIAAQTLVVWSLALVAAGLAPAVLLSTIMRLGGVSVALGMLAGVAVAGMHLLDSPYDPIRGSPSAAAGLAGAVIGFIVMAASGLAAPLLGASWRSRAATPTAAAIAVVVAENAVDAAASDAASATTDSAGS
jgi:Na+/proline symporter